MIKQLTKGIVTASIAAFSLLSMSFAVHTITFTPVSDSSTVAFKIKNLGTKVDGTLGNLKGTIVFDPANMAKAKN